MIGETDRKEIREMVYWFEYSLRIGRVYENLYYKTHLVEVVNIEDGNIRNQVHSYNNLIGQKV